MTSSLLSLYSDSWTLSERPGSNLIRFVPSASDSGSSVVLDRSTAMEGSIGSVSPQKLHRLTELADITKMGDLSQLSMAQRSLETLHRVEESMHRENVYVTECMVMHQFAWDVNAYSTSKSDFPLENVPIKCNILKTLFELLQEYQSSGSNSEAQLENVAKVLHYLKKLIQASQLDLPVPQSLAPPPAATQPLRKVRTDASSRSSHHPRDSRQSSVGQEAPPYPSRMSVYSGSGKSRILSKFFAPAKSRDSVHTRSTITVQPVGATSTAPASINTNTSPSKTPMPPQEENSSSLDAVISSHKIQDLESMKNYKECIISLAKTLTALPQNDQNNIVFHFVDKSIIPFILRDCKLLLLHYLHEEVILKL